MINSRVVAVKVGRHMNQDLGGWSDAFHSLESFDVSQREVSLRDISQSDNYTSKAALNNFMAVCPVGKEV